MQIILGKILHFPFMLKSKLYSLVNHFDPFKYNQTSIAYLDSNPIIL